MCSILARSLASFLVNNTYKSNVKGKAGSNVTPGLIRIIANYLKIQSTLGDFRARAPAVIMAIRNGASTVSSGIPLDIGPVACAFGLSFERQLLGAVAMPVVIIVGVSFLCALLFLRAACCPWVCRCRGPSILSRLRSRWSQPPAPSPAALASGTTVRARATSPPPVSPSDSGSNAAKVEALISQAAESRQAVPPESRPLVAGKYLQFCQSAITILFFLVYSMLVKQVFTAWRLYDEPIEDKWYLAADFGVSTDSPAYSRIVIVAVVGVVLWVVGIPALAVWLLYRNRHRLLDDDFAASFAFLYAGYNIGTAGQVNEAAIQQARTVVRKLKDLTGEEEQTSQPQRRSMLIGKRRPASSASKSVDPAPATTRPTSPRETDDDSDTASASERKGESESEIVLATSSGSPARATPRQDRDAQAEAKSSKASRAAPGAALPKSGGDAPAAGPPDASKLRWPPSSHASSLGAKRSRHKSLAMSRGKNVAFLEDIVDQFETTVSGQSQSWWFWEVVVLARLVAVTVVAIFVEDVFVQSYLALGIVIASTVAQLAAQPYSDSSLNFAETMGLLTILVTQMGSLLWALDTTELAKLDDVAVTIVLIVVNVAVLVVFVVMLILSVLGEHRILRIPVVGKRLATAFFRERDLRRQFLLARNRRQAVNEEHKSSNAMAAVQAKASRQGSSAVAISTRASSPAKPAASPPGSATP